MQIVLVTDKTDCDKDLTFFCQVKINVVFYHNFLYFVTLLSCGNISVQSMLDLEEESNCHTN